MKTFEKWLKENRNEELPKETVNAEWFLERDLPMIVECSCCGMTMALPNAMIDENGYTYCKECAEEE